MDNCCCSMLKYLLFFTNFLVFIMSITGLAVGIFAYVDGETLSELFALIPADEELAIGIYKTAAIIIMTVSAFVMLVSFFGCCGAIKESKCMLGVYSVCIFILLGGMITGAVIGYDKVLDELKEPLFKTMKDYDERSTASNNVAAVKAWDDAQEGYKCCGLDSYSDWQSHGKFPYSVSGEGNVYVPGSCCQRADDVSACRSSPGGEDLPGCWAKFEDDIEEHVEIIIGVGLAVAGVMFLNFLFAVATMCNI